jgi:hypothetical protein
MPKNVITDKTYTVGTKDVILSVIVGEGQFGRHDIELAGDQLVRVTGDVIELRLGAGADLAGKKLRVRTLGADINTNTNRLTMSYELRGGDGVLKFRASEKVASDFGSLLFKTSVEFQ